MEKTLSEDLSLMNTLFPTKTYAKPVNTFSERDPGHFLCTPGTIPVRVPDKTESKILTIA